LEHSIYEKNVVQGLLKYFITSHLLEARQLMFLHSSTVPFCFYPFIYAVKVAATKVHSGVLVLRQVVGSSPAGGSHVNAVR